MKEAEPHPSIRFGVFELDLRAGELRKQGVKVKLQEQPFLILQILLEHPNKLVTREELERRLWPSGTFVDFEHGLYNAIKKLREALGDSAENPRFIETLSKRGYRFIGSVSVDGVNGGPDLKEATSRNEAQKRTRLIPWTIGVALTVLAAVATLFLLNLFRQRGRVSGGAPVTKIQSLAVLPLVNLSGDPAQEYFSDGMTDALITDLAQIGSLKVISRTSVMSYKKTEKPLPDIAHELNVDGIIEGTVQRSGDHVRVTAQLVQGPTDKTLWAKSYERDMRDAFALEADVAGDIARQVQARLATPNQALRAQPAPLNPRALDAYLQGSYHLNKYAKGAGDQEKGKAAEFFHRAIDADPNFAPAYNGLAKAHLGLLWPSKQDAEIATKAAERAVALDPDLSDAHTTLGEMKYSSWNWQGAEEEYRRAIALNPNNATAHEDLGELLDGIGRLDEGWSEYQVAQEIDPSNNHSSDALDRRGEYDRAIAMLEMMVKRNPNDGYLQLALAQTYLKKGMYEEGTQGLDRVWTLFALPQVAAKARRAYAVSGYRGAIKESAKAFEHLMATNQAFVPVTIAELYTILGEKDRAFYWLEQAYARHDAGIASTDLGLQRLKSEFLLDPLRSDPRYKDLIRRVGLPP